MLSSSFPPLAKIVVFPHPAIEDEVRCVIHQAIPLGHDIYLKPGGLGQPYARCLSFNKGLPIFLGSSFRIGYWPCLHHKEGKHCPFENNVSCLSSISAKRERPGAWPGMCVQPECPFRMLCSMTETVEGTKYSQTNWGEKRWPKNIHPHGAHCF